MIRLAFFVCKMLGNRTLLSCPRKIFDSKRPKGITETDLSGEWE